MGSPTAGTVALGLQMVAKSPTGMTGATGMEASNAQKVVQRDQVLAEYRQICADIEAADRLGFDTTAARALANRFLVSFAIDRDQLVTGAWIIETFGCSRDILDRIERKSGRGSNALYRLGAVIDYGPRSYGENNAEDDVKRPENPSATTVEGNTTRVDRGVVVGNDREARRKAAVRTALKHVA